MGRWCIAMGAWHLGEASPPTSRQAVLSEQVRRLLVDVASAHLAAPVRFRRHRFRYS